MARHQMARLHRFVLALLRARAQHRGARARNQRYEDARPGVLNSIKFHRKRTPGPRSLPIWTSEATPLAT